MYNGREFETSPLQGKNLFLSDTVLPDAAHSINNAIF